MLKQDWLNSKMNGVFWSELKKIRRQKKYKYDGMLLKL